MSGTQQLVNGIDPRLMALLISAFQSGKAGQLVFYHETYVRAWELTKELNPARLLAEDEVAVKRKDLRWANHALLNWLVHQPEGDMKDEATEAKRRIRAALAGDQAQVENK